jgi:hypothetical protein
VLVFAGVVQRQNACFPSKRSWVQSPPPAPRFERLRDVHAHRWRQSVRLGWLRTPAGNIGSNPIHCVAVVGPVAQLGERIHGMDEVRGSSPLRSTKFITSYNSAKTVKNYMICGVAVYRFGPCTLNAMMVGSTPINATKFCTRNSAARVPLSHGGSRRFESCWVHQVW